MCHIWVCIMITHSNVYHDDTFECASWWHIQICNLMTHLNILPVMTHSSWYTFKCVIRRHIWICHYVAHLNVSSQGTLMHNRMCHMMHIWIWHRMTHSNEYIHFWIYLDLYSQHFSWCQNIWFVPPSHYY